MYYSGINYIGHEQGVLSGCHNDVLNMKEYMKKVHGFAEKDITVMLDDDKHMKPTGKNILAAIKKMVEASEPGDALFFHYSGEISMYFVVMFAKTPQDC